MTILPFLVFVFFFPSQPRSVRSFFDYPVSLHFDKRYVGKYLNEKGLYGNMKYLLLLQFLIKYYKI